MKKDGTKVAAKLFHHRDTEATTRLKEPKITTGGVRAEVLFLLFGFLCASVSLW